MNPPLSDDGSPLIRAVALSKSYGQTRALDGLDLALGRGEILGLLGPNGAGKTTAIHLMLGLLTPTSGEVTVFGLSPFTERHRIASRLNFCSAYVQLPSNLRVLENLRVYAGLYGVKDPRRKIERLLELFEIGPLAGRVTGALSSGEKTRLNLAKCFLNDPELLLLDEPTASLDPEMADTVRRTLKKIQKEARLGILYTSHNMPEVEALCDRVLFIHEGRTIVQGPPAEVMRHFESASLDEVFIKIVRRGDLILKASP
ncbi:MAG TPA: ABC transporter ATP-binding protein [Candidatus Eisenbacteria bacterium]|jgi:ABC-2 type transport system ATP-binding protein|nr:ABC transporter ATP-binding protein [Candidatus Eisenbacteria bacterium]